ncbi:MAG: SBBP repeat-containing protein [Chloroflexi bacterium]|nr:SBBP repeat-containing protein [Chloroflexota bacterium]
MSTQHWLYLTIRRLSFAVCGLLLVWPQAATAYPVAPSPFAASLPALRAPQSIVALPHPPPDAAQVSAALRGAPLMFVENVGQFDAQARFLVRGAQGAIHLADDGLWFTLVERAQPNPSARTARPPSAPATASRKGVHLRLTFVGANPHPTLEPFAPVETTVSFFKGHDPSGWHAAVPVWGGVRYRDLYPGLDLELSGEGGRLQPRLVAHPGADPSVVRLRLEGAEMMQLDGEQLRLTTAVGAYALPLLALVDTAGAPLETNSAARIEGTEVAVPFARPPAMAARAAAPSSGTADLLYSTFLGGSSDDWGYGIAVDASGAAYVTGYTFSSNFPTTPGAFDTRYNGDGDVFVSKLNASGTALVYSTVLGGIIGSESGLAIAVDASGAAYVTGYTRSSAFPTTPGAFDTSYNGGPYDAFVTKLNASGSALLYSTFLGGSSDDYGYGIAVDVSGAAYVTGYTASSGFPTTPGAFDTSYNGGFDVFVTKLNASGSTLVYSTFLGGSNDDWSLGIAVDVSGAAYVTG